MPRALVAFAGEAWGLVMVEGRIYAPPEALEAARTLRTEEERKWRESRT
jgi:hypothetical protein